MDVQAEAPTVAGVSHLCAVSRPLMDAVERSCRQAGEACEQGDVETALVCVERCRIWLGREGSIPEDDLLLWSSFAQRLVAMWVLPEQIHTLLKLLWIYPWDAAVRSDLLHGLHYRMDIEPRVLTGQHIRWAQLHVAGRGPSPPHTNDPTPDRRLRIGYVSADLRRHCVAFFLEPLLGCHDRRAFEVLGYSHVQPCRRDQVSERLEALFDGYRCVWDVDDRSTAAQIRRDQIDVLVDLGGHTHHNRLPLFALRPAPIQVSYLGYPGTTGLSQMDYRLTDDLADPPGAEQSYTDELVRLDTCFACYRPADHAPPVQRPPVLSSGRITFGSFVGSAKHNPFILSLWSEVLKANPRTDLLLRFEGAEDPAIQRRCRGAFGRLGIDPNRVRFDGWRDPMDHLAAYGRIDIALDSFPWNGHTTQCEALWMGVPVISLSGRGFVSRMGLSVLSRMGLEGLVAASREEYVAKATTLAGDPRALATLRAGLRDRMRSSPVCDAPRHARAVEQAYRALWHRWCQQASPARNCSPRQ